MKLPSVTSFFFCFLVLVLCFSCEKEKKGISGNIDPALERLDSIVDKKNASKKYDSALIYGHKEYKLAKQESDEKYLKISLARIQTAHRKKGDYDSAIYYADELYELSKKYKDTSYMAKAIYKRGQSYKAIDSFKLAYQDFTSSKNLYLQIKDTIQAARKLLDIATLEKKKASFGASQLSCIEGLQYVENTSQISLASKLYYTIAVAAKEQGNFLVAEKRIDQALALAKDSVSIKVIKPNNVIAFYDTKANVFKEKGNYTLAINIYESLLNNSLGLGKLSKRIKARINGNLAHTLFLSKGFNNRSVVLLNESLSYYSETKDISSLISINMKLAEIYSEQNKKKALLYLDKVIDLGTELGNNKSLYEAYQHKIGIDSSKENIDTYLALEKEVEREEDMIQTQFANAKFDFEKSEKDRITAENEANKLEIKEARRTGQLLISLLVMVIFIVLVFFIYQRLKRRHKIEKVKTVHVTEARISTKVHDELANDLYELMTQLETANPEKEVVLDKLDTIYNQARDISRQIQSVDTDKGFAEELSNLFRTYQSNLVNVLLKRYDTDIWKGISSHVKVTLYRVLQEFLTNMKKHSNASLVVVSIEKQNKQLFIQYIDNGKGFTAESSKNGLRNAENRIQAIKGKLTFDTELHKGCKFSINVPV